jgi:hypothetical protein
MARRFALGLIQLIEFCKYRRQCRIARIPINEILEKITARFRLLELQMGVGDADQAGDKNGMRCHLPLF